MQNETKLGKRTTYTGVLSCLDGLRLVGSFVPAGGVFGLHARSTSG